MNLRIPFFKNKTLVIKIYTQPCWDEILIAMMKERYKNPVNGKWRLDKIKAVKFYRSQTGLGIRVSMKYIDNLIEKNHLEVERDYCENPVKVMEEKYRG
jgi:hypothetical protein